MDDKPLKRRDAAIIHRGLQLVHHFPHLAPCLAVGVQGFAAQLVV
jgi:hypothetical protein